MIKSNMYLALGLTFLFSGSTVLAQQTSPTNPEEILNDKNGKYVALESDSSVLLEKGWFAQMRCTTAPNGLINARIGRSLFRFPEESLRGVLTGSLILTQGTGKKYRRYFRADTGCPENPIVVALAELVPPGAGIFRDIAIKETPQHQGLTKTAAGLLDLRDHATEKPGTCLPVPKGAMTICSGNSSAGPVSYLLATDKSLLLESGAPMNIKCNHAPSLVCGVNDDISEGVTYSAVVKGQISDFTVASMQDAHKAAHALVDGYRTQK